MKDRPKIINIIAILIGLLVIGLNLLPLFKYLYNPDTSIANVNRYYLFYIISPLTILGFVLLAFTKWGNPKNKWKYISLLLFNIISAIIIGWFLESDANKVLITLNNMSDDKIENIKIIARNNQNIDLGNLPAGQSRTTYCDCREVVLPKDSGLKLMFKINGYSFNDYILEPHSNFSDQVLEIRVLSDTVFYRSYIDYTNDTLWGRIGKPSSLHKWGKLK